ncbi:MAG: DUF3794 domain-containing protein [Clostridia bacterium]|nr:DUF3794 domain-containing protein [Clostridia bacterium]
MTDNFQNTVQQLFSPLSNGGKIHIESEVILPDYCPDLLRTVKTEITPKITSQTHYSDQNGINITIDGTALFKILYLSDSTEKLCSTFFTQPFTHSFKLHTDDCSDLDNIFDSVSLVTDSCSCRPVSPRKAVIRGDLSVSPEIKLNRTVEYFDGNDLSCEVLKTSSCFCSMTGIGEADYTISEKINLPVDSAPCEEILDCSMRYVCDSVKTAEGKVLFTATAYFNCLYRTETGISSFCQPIEISQIMEVAGTESIHQADVRISPTSLRADIDVDNYGENRVVAVDFSYFAKSVVYGNKTFSPVSDVYCPEYEFEAQYSDISLFPYNNTIKENIPVRASVKLKNPETVSLENICPAVSLRGWVIENGVLSLDGRLKVNMTAVLPAGYDGIEENTDFSAKIPLENPDIRKCELGVSVKEVNCILSGNSIEVTAEVTVSGPCFTQNQIHCVTAYNRGEKKKPCDKPPIILYYPSKEETLWDVAKKYSVPQKTLCEFNGTDASKPLDTVIKIPLV